MSGYYNVVVREVYKCYDNWRKSCYFDNDLENENYSENDYDGVSCMNRIDFCVEIEKMFWGLS